MSAWPIRSQRLRVSILDDYQDVVRTLDCFSKLQGHDVTIWTDAVADVDVLAERLADADVLVLLRERTKVGRSAAQPPAKPQADQPERPRAAHRFHRMHTAWRASFPRR